MHYNFVTRSLSICQHSLAFLTDFSTLSDSSLASNQSVRKGMHALCVCGLINDNSNCVNVESIVISTHKHPLLIRILDGGLLLTLSVHVQGLWYIEAFCSLVNTSSAAEKKGLVHETKAFCLLPI